MVLFSSIYNINPQLLAAHLNVVSQILLQKLRSLLWKAVQFLTVSLYLVVNEVREDYHCKGCSVYVVKIDFKKGSGPRQIFLKRVCLSAVSYSYFINECLVVSLEELGVFDLCRVVNISSFFLQFCVGRLVDCSQAFLIIFCLGFAFVLFFQFPSPQARALFTSRGDLENSSCV